MYQNRIGILAPRQPAKRYDWLAIDRIEAYHNDRDAQKQKLPNPINLWPSVCVDINCFGLHCPNKRTYCGDRERKYDKGVPPRNPYFPLNRPPKPLHSPSKRAFALICQRRHACFTKNDSGPQCAKPDVSGQQRDGSGPRRQTYRVYLRT